MWRLAVYRELENFSLQSVRRTLTNGRNPHRTAPHPMKHTSNRQSAACLQEMGTSLKEVSKSETKVNFR